METLYFQPSTEEPTKKDILPVQKFRTEGKSLEDRLDKEKREARESDMVDLFFADRGGMDGSPGGSEFQNRLTNFLMQENIDSSPTGPFMTKFTRKISSDPRNESNVDVPKIVRGVASVASYLLETAKEPVEPGRQRMLGFNKELDDRYAIDVIDSSYELVEGQMVVHKLHLVQVKSHESAARSDAQNIYKNHAEFVNSFEMMAKWRAARQLDFLAEGSLPIEQFESFAEDEILTVMVAHSDGLGKGNFDIATLRQDLQSSLGKDEVSIEELNFLGKIVRAKKDKEGLDDDEINAVDEIVSVIQGLVADYEDEKVAYKAPVIFADDAEIKSLIVAHTLSSQEKGGVLEDLTRDIVKPIRH